MEEQGGGKRMEMQQLEDLGGKGELKRNRSVRRRQGDSKDDDNKWMDVKEVIESRGRSSRDRSGMRWPTQRDCSQRKRTRETSESSTSSHREDEVNRKVVILKENEKKKLYDEPIRSRKRMPSVDVVEARRKTVEEAKKQAKQKLNSHKMKSNWVPESPKRPESQSKKNQMAPSTYDGDPPIHKEIDVINNNLAKPLAQSSPVCEVITEEKMDAIKIAEALDEKTKGADVLEEGFNEQEGCSGLQEEVPMRPVFQEDSRFQGLMMLGLANQIVDGVIQSVIKKTSNFDNEENSSFNQEAIGDQDRSTEEEISTQDEMQVNKNENIGNILGGRDDSSDRKDISENLVEVTSKMEKLVQRKKELACKLEGLKVMGLHCFQLGLF